MAAVQIAGSDGYTHRNFHAVSFAVVLFAFPVAAVDNIDSVVLFAFPFAAAVLVFVFDKEFEAAAVAVDNIDFHDNTEPVVAVAVADKAVVAVDRVVAADDKLAVVVVDKRFAVETAHVDAAAGFSVLALLVFDCGCLASAFLV